MRGIGSDRIERFVTPCTWPASTRDERPLSPNPERPRGPTGWQPSRLPPSMVASVTMPKRRESKRGVVISEWVVRRRCFRFDGVGGAKWSTAASAGAIVTMRLSIGALGKAVRSAVSSGFHEMTNWRRKTRSIGQHIKRWGKVNEVQIPGTKNALYRAFLDSLVLGFPRSTDRSNTNA